MNAYYHQEYRRRGRKRKGKRKGISLYRCEVCRGFHLGRRKKHGKRFRL